MSDVDLTKVPTGELGWAALLGYVLEADDRVERYFLEVKSDVDLNTKQGRAKVAKFILGAANRDPSQAARRFGGHAVMLLGVGAGAAPGIPGFEAMDLARDVKKFVGVDGPRWDFDRIPAAAGQDVIAIVVEPPTGKMWACCADGDGLHDGDIYVRADGETRRATGDEIRAMIARAAAPSAPEIDVSVQIIGEVAAVRIDDSVLIEAAEAEASALLAPIAPRPRTPYGSPVIDMLSASSLTYDMRSKDEFREEVDAWLARMRALPGQGVVRTLARLRSGIRIHVTNGTRTFLRDVRIDIEFVEPVIAAEWREPDKRKGVNLLDGVPEEWGRRSISTLIGHGIVPAAPRTRNGIAQIKQKVPARLALEMASLRPEEDFTTADDEVVLVLFISEEPRAPIKGRWRLTADAVNDVYEGEFDIPANFTDLREPIAKLLKPSDEDPVEDLT